MFVMAAMGYRCEPSVQGGGGRGDSNKMPGCVCWLSENGPILNDTFGCNTYLY